MTLRHSCSVVGVGCHYASSIVTTIGIVYQYVTVEANLPMSKLQKNNKYHNYHTMPPAFEHQ